MESALQTLNVPTVLTELKALDLNLDFDNRIDLLHKYLTLVTEAPNPWTNLPGGNLIPVDEELSVSEMMYRRAKGKILQALVKKWAEPLGEPVQVIADIAGMLIFPVKLLRQVLIAHPEIHPFDVLYTLLTMEAGPSFGMAATRLLEADPVEGLSWKPLLDLARRRNRRDAMGWLEDRVRDELPSVPKPHWIRSQVAESKTVDATEVATEFTNLFETDPDMTLKLAKIALRGSEVDRVWGPLNPILENPCPTSPDGCRMLSCCCREVDDEDDEGLLPVPETKLPTDPVCLRWWDEPRCDGCDFHIPKPEWCLRFPVKGGGWVGKFCSLTCLQKNPPRPLDETAIERLNHLSATLSEVGIQER